MTEAIHYNEKTACEICGRYGAYEFEEHPLCMDCYQNQGSCCPEFGGEDQWRIGEEAGSTGNARARNAGD
jgi:hypothetical protein